MPETKKSKESGVKRAPFAATLGGLGGELVALLMRGNPATGRRLGIAAGALLAHPELRDQALTALARVMKTYQEVAKAPTKK